MSQLQFKRVSDKINILDDRYWIDTNGKVYKQLVTPYIRDVNLSRTGYKDILKNIKDEYIFYKDKYIIFKNGLILSEIKPSYIQSSKSYMLNLYFKDKSIGYINIALHRLMCAVWKDLDYMNKNLHVHHKNKNREDNSIDNLEVLTPQEHINKHRKRIEIYKNKELLKICSLKETMEYCNIKHSSSIYNVINGKYKQCKGYTFKEI